MRTTEEVLQDIKELINTKGYIYALCMIIFSDFHINPEKLQEIDYRSRLNKNEVSLLLGFLIQNEINLSTPDSPQNLFELKQKTYELMEELHKSFMYPVIEKLQESIKYEHKIENYRKEQKEFFGKGGLLIEPIFYSGDGVYDLQYLDFLEKKYKYDKEWLVKHKKYDIEETKNIVVRIKNILQEKSEKVHLYDIKEILPQIIEEKKKKYPDEDWDKYAKDMIPILELYQYVELFYGAHVEGKSLSMDDIGEEEWKSFYNGLIDLFVIRKSDFNGDPNIDSFLSNFSLYPKDALNSQFQGIGNFNCFNAKPIIKLDEERYFVPIIFSVFEAVYECPFYWMWLEDHSYRDQLSVNRGKTGEDISYELLSQVFGKDRTFKSIKITTKKGTYDTDIDVLCVLGSKALCVQVKSKKLTELSRTGDDEQLQKDFQGAVQDAYSQGLISRQKILDRNAKYFDDTGKEIYLSEEIDEVYIMGVTTENYPSLTHQSHVMLEKKDADPFPIITTIFDLELIVHYLNDPYELLYYIKQRTSLMDHFKADEEMAYLGYHLDRKLWKMPNTDVCMIDTDYAQLIDRNYYPLKVGLEVSDKGDAIKTRWKNEEFDNLCNRLKTLNQPKITDIIFHLLDWSGEARKNLVDFMIKTKQSTLKDRRSHNFSMPPNDSNSPRVGLTYISLNSNNSEELAKCLFNLCQARKYQSKGDVWIGFGSLIDSKEMIDAVVYNDHKWKYDVKLEEYSKEMLEGGSQGIQIRIGRKIGRNDKCHCGSTLKYKNCCGKNK